MKIELRRFGIALAILGLMAGMAGQAEAGSITSLFSTGVDDSGTPLPDGTIGDPHYTLVSVPGGTSSLRVRTLAGGHPVGGAFWMGDNSTSAWIGPNNTASADGDLGLYTYRTTFTLAGLDPSTASITGRWSTDNAGIDIRINGVSTLSSTAGFTSWNPFGISTGFTSGINTLDFIVRNDGGPTGLRVEMTGTADVPVSPVTAAPEPSTMALIGTALPIGLVVAARRRKPAAA